jgi:hypothetical protein
LTCRCPTDCSAFHTAAQSAVKAGLMARKSARGVALSGQPSSSARPTTRARQKATPITPAPLSVLFYFAVLGLPLTHNGGVLGHLTLLF